jgi:hypothetical protein
LSMKRPSDARTLNLDWFHVEHSVEG